MKWGSEYKLPVVFVDLPTSWTVKTMMSLADRFNLQIRPPNIGAIFDQEETEFETFIIPFYSLNETHKFGLMFHASRLGGRTIAATSTQNHALLVDPVRRYGGLAVVDMDIHINQLANMITDDNMIKAWRRRVQ